MTLVKICGLTRAEDVALAEELGADFLGFVFVPESPRYIAPEKVRAIGSRRAKRVGVFRGASIEEMQRTSHIAHLDVVQIHGRYQSGGSAAALLKVIHAFRVEDALPDTTTTDADYVLFDTGGGTGKTFDWTLLATYPRHKPFFLAGGITPDNVAHALRTNPDGIDLSSGVESAPGIKDHHKLRTLFARIRR